MSLAIRAKKIEAVLLEDGWHEVKRGTFWWDAFEVLAAELDDPDFCFQTDVAQGAESLGFGFTDDRGKRVFGPWSSILAFRCCK